MEPINEIGPLSIRRHIVPDTPEATQFIEACRMPTIASLAMLGFHKSRESERLLEQDMDFLRPFIAKYADGN